MSARARLFVLALLIAWSGDAQAQVFSPGPLARAHAALEGLTSCTKCHESGAAISDDKCMTCHREIAVRFEKRRGFHGTLTTQRCATCHTDHKGLNGRLIDWGGPQRRFDHRRTGFNLTGAHERADCKACHDARRITDDAISKLVSTTTRQSFLGLPTSCSSCHFDEHRGQEGLKCDQCHTTERFVGAALFSHARTDFALTGKHKAVKCSSCHEAVRDDETRADVFPAPMKREYVEYKDIPHAKCSDCHQDPHAGRFGATCASCHSTAGWAQIVTGGDKARGFHETTRFPLRGAHAAVGCKDCHGPWPGRAAVFRGTPFAKCTDCHLDAHAGQLGNGERGQCSRCHTVDGFSPVEFGVAEHETARFVLEGSHQAVACGRCHTNDKNLVKRVPERELRELRKKKRPERVSLVRLLFPDITGRCEQCHADVHGGQFASRMQERGCAVCHQVESWTAVAFAHEDTGFPLTGRHIQASCASCHQAPKPAAPVVFKGTPKTCAQCHVDTHRGQLDEGEKPADCASCHQTSAFKPSTFSHDDKARETYRLEGKHRDLDCGRCHAKVDVSGAMVVRYRPVPTSCAGCHVDAHKGAFGGFSP